MFPKEALAIFVSEGTHWLLGRRSELRPAFQPLPADASSVFRAYFPEACLTSARFGFVPEISNPPFYAALEGSGLGIPLDFRDMAGITFVDTIAVSKRLLPESPQRLLELLFHEMVHVVQYAVLGVDRFVPAYVHGWARSGERYDGIPLEVQAYDLQAQFTSGFPSAFSVEEAVRSRFGG